MAKIALLIGVSEYEPGLNPLPAAVKDIEAMQRVLKDVEMGGFDEAKMLANPDRQVMESEIEILFAERTKDDLVLLFFSGHGIKDDGGKLYFATRITRKNPKGDLIRSTAVSANFVHESMSNSRARRQAIILDCCFSGAFDRALQAKDDGLVDLQSQLGAEGRVVLTSSSSTEYSFEQQGSNLSIYTRYLVEGIETGAGDRNSDGFVSMAELHDYAASKVRETAPKMTPKIIVLKDKGFEIVLSKARVTDPQLRYRKAASRYANAGTIRPAGRAILNTLRNQLGLTAEEAAEIEAEVLRPYQERLESLKTYRETLIAEAELEYPLSQEAREELNMLQEHLGLRDEDIAPIQREVEAKFVQKSELYQQSLVQYEQAFTKAIQQEFPLKLQTRQDLENLQKSLGLRGEDTARIEQPLLQQAELKYQDKLRQEAEQQRQEQEKAEYENKLRRYEQEFARAVQAEYPLNQHIVDGLMAFQQQLGLKYEDVARIERPIREPAEVQYRKTLREKAKQQRQAELERKRQYDSFQEKKKSFRNLINRLYKILQSLHIIAEANNIGNNIKKIEKLIQEGSFKVLVLGERKRGKSTFINALLGNDILPARLRPCTNVVTEVKWGEYPHALLHFTETEDNQKHPPQKIPIEQLEEYVCMSDFNENEFYNKRYSKVEVFYPVEFCKNGIEIIDCPAVDEHSIRQNFTYNYLLEVDVVLFIFSCEALASVSELRFIDNALELAGKERFFFICNKIDRIKVEERGDLENYAISRLAPRTKHRAEGVFFISAFDALEGRLYYDAERVTKSGIVQVEQELEKFIILRGLTNIFSSARAVQAVIDSAIGAILHQQSILKIDLQTLESRYESVNKPLHQLEIEREQKLQGIELLRRELDVVKIELDALMREISI